MHIIKRITVGFFLFLPLLVRGQSLENIGMTRNEGLRVVSLVLSDSVNVPLPAASPVFSFRLNNHYYESDDVTAVLSGSHLLMNFSGGIQAEFISRGGSHPGWMAELIFHNNGSDTVSISDVVPFAENKSNVYITGYGPWDLARARLFRPGYSPVRVILPDNAWEMGFTTFKVNDTTSLSAIARRTSVKEGKKSRYETALPPGGSVTYSIYGDVFNGAWQEGLRLMFHNRYLYDLSTFNNELYQREDLKWIRSSYLIVLQMAWDREYYNRFTGKYGFDDILLKYNSLFGNIDVFGIWPTWPRLGLDERNQWDMYRNLPGGLQKLREFSREARLSNTHFFIAYNPWDNSTRQEDQYAGMADLISATEADGVVLDTRGSSSYELQKSADSVRSGVIMYSEGMAIAKDMPGIISGRVHNAIFLSPELNLNRLIRPDFSIFRVCDVGEDVLHREISIAFFNGHGTELNLFRPGGRGDEYQNDLGYLAKTTMILRQNSEAFNDSLWTPLLETTLDKTYVNRWSAGEKTIYTVLNMDSRGIDTALFEVIPNENKHFVSLWRHQEIEPVVEKSKSYIHVITEGWKPAYSGTRLESSVDCIAELPQLLKVEAKGNMLYLKTEVQGTINIWKSNPDYSSAPLVFTSPVDTILSIDNLLGFDGGHIVVQLVSEGELRDERILSIKEGKPWLVTAYSTSPVATSIPSGMILIPGATITYRLHSKDDFIAYPVTEKDVTAKVDSILIDKYPVTNEQYYKFVKESKYIPGDTTNYLKHWVEGIYVAGQEKYPVVYISYEDAKAYAKWAGKRLPSEAEWQLSAQGTDKRLWPWGNEFHATKCNSGFGRATPVDAFPKGDSQYGVSDLVGNIWQMTDDVYCNGTDYFLIIRGGSYYKPESSGWYIQGGPQQLDFTQMLLLVSPGFDRSATVGFRCVKDIAPGLKLK